MTYDNGCRGCRTLYKKGRDMVLITRNKARIDLEVHLEKSPPVIVSMNRDEFLAFADNLADVIDRYKR